MRHADQLPVVIELCPNRRLYDGAAGHYRSLDELTVWKQRRLPFLIVDSSSGEDLTSLILSGR